MPKEAEPKPDFLWFAILIAVGVAGLAFVRLSLRMCTGRIGIVEPDLWIIVESVCDVCAFATFVLLTAEAIWHTAKERIGSTKLLIVLTAAEAGFAVCMILFANTMARLYFLEQKQVQEAALLFRAAGIGTVLLVAVSGILAFLLRNRSNWLNLFVMIASAVFVILIVILIPRMIADGKSLATFLLGFTAGMFPPFAVLMPVVLKAREKRTR